MFWTYNQRKFNLIPSEYFDPKKENRIGCVLSQAAVNFVRKKQLEYQLSHQHKKKFSAFLKPCDYRVLEWPVLIGLKHNPIVIITDNDIGHGSYGKVYLGFCLDTGKPVGIKIQPFRDNEPLCWAEAHAELVNTKKLNKLIDFFCVEIDSVPYSFLVKEYAYGVDIFHVLYSGNRKNKLPLENQLIMAIGLVEILLSFHQKGFIHRDLSLGNFLWDAQSKKAELIDFSKMVSLKGEQGVWAQPDGGIRGLAPELTQLNEDNNVYYTRESDVYALGIIFCDIFSCIDVNFDPKKLLSYYMRTSCHEGVPQFLEQAAPDIFLRTTVDGHVDKIANLVKLMVDGNANKRPSLENILSSLKWINRLVIKENIDSRQLHERKKRMYLTL